ncbi:MAG: hypothetical protein IPQ07_29725 [Myxococcales bacterium]|nr:hypothetical protein [Myxococcales bacterium]
MWRALVLLGTVACVEPSLVSCPGSDLTCPVGLVCDEVHHTCVTGEQLESCVGLADGMTCLVGGSLGYCSDAVCLPIVCGNGLVDRSEVCDDGNLVSNDGCNATCSSNETCGNGVVDAITGELCDDANRLDGDGCDSRCRPEQETWTIKGAALHTNSTPGQLVYDAARHQMLYVTDGTTWRWDGTRWSLITAAGLGIFDWAWSFAVYNPDRQTVVFIGHTQTGAVGREEIYEWDGTSWTRVVTSSSPNLSQPVVTYDPVRHLLLVAQLGSTITPLWTLDLATGTWVAKPSIGQIFSYQGGFAFDAVRGVAVLVTGDGKVFEWNGTAWTTIVAAPPVATGWGVTFDPRVGAVIAVGGATPSNKIAKWTGAAWVTLAETLPSPRNIPEVAFDPDRNRRIVFGGSPGNAAYPLLGDVFEYDGSGWQHIDSDAPPEFDDFGRLSYAYDPVRRTLVQLGGTAGATTGKLEVWTRTDDRWHHQGPSPIPYQNSALAAAYDPVRGGIVVNAGDFSTWLLDGEQWRKIEDAGTSDAQGMVAMAYDPIRRAMVGLDGTQTWSLGADDRWHMLAAWPAPTVYLTLAFDARAGRLVAAANMDVFELADTGWSPTLSPGSFYRVVEDPRRGTVNFVRGTGSLWERVAGAWFEHPALPIATNGSASFAPIEGTLLLIGTVRNARLLFERTFVGSSPRDACTGGDEDGDQLIDCADPDCWWSCTPTCPPRASCP